MSRPLLPPNHVRIPVRILYNKSLAPAARDTFCQLMGLGWGLKETNGEIELPEVSMTELSAMFGKSQSTIYGHLAYLRDWEVLRWRPSNGKTLKIWLIVGELEPEPDDSRILEKPLTPLLNPPQGSEINNGVGINSAFQNSGKKPIGRKPSKADSRTEHDSRILEKPLTPLLNPPQESEINNSVGINSAFQNSGKRPIGRKPSKADPRTKHPAIQCVKGITSRYPPKELYDEIIQVLGNSPKGELLAACRKEWLKRGYNPNAWAWLLDWYPAGGAPGRNGGGPVGVPSKRVYSEEY
jgi:hypothetical protein